MDIRTSFFKFNTQLNISCILFPHFVCWSGLDRRFKLKLIIKYLKNAIYTLVLMPVFLIFKSQVTSQPGGLHPLKFDLFLPQVCPHVHVHMYM